MNDDDIDARLHARTAQWRTAQDAARTLAAERRRERFAQWIADNTGKLEAMHHHVRAEVESCAWDCIKADRDVNLTQGDIRGAKTRVASRLRIKLYGALPDSYEEALRQHNEIRADIGLPALPARHRHAAE